MESVFLTESVFYARLLLDTLIEAAIDFDCHEWSLRLKLQWTGFQENRYISILGFSKTFDSVNLKTLLKKARKYGGVCGVDVNLFESYVSVHVQHIATNSSQSRILPITHGVPQGSIFDQLLHQLFINYFPTSSFFSVQLICLMTLWPLVIWLSLTKVS